MDRSAGVKWVGRPLGGRSAAASSFPFPWPIRRFFGCSPAAVDPEALVELARAAGGFETKPDELVILAYQVWYLAPSLPIRSPGESASRGGPEPGGRVADRMPKHVVLGGDRGWPGYCNPRVLGASRWSLRPTHCGSRLHS